MIGRTINNYRILDKIGEGGMGVVYKAEDIKLKRIVAIKFLPSELTSNDTAKERFITEAQTISTIDHPNICTIYEINETSDGQMFIVLAYYGGKTLKSRLKKDALGFEQGLDLATQMIEGIQAAHSKDIVHRDIKSSNLMLTEDDRVKLVDFGLAKLADRSGLSFDSTTAGTLAYMSPEQAQALDVDKRSDLWSFGVVLYESLTGELPFKGEYEQAVIYSIVNEDPVPARKLNKSIPKEFDKIILKCLEKDKAARYQSADEIVVDLKKLKEETLRKKQEEEKKKMDRTLKVMGTVFAALAASMLIYMLGKQFLFRQKELNPRVVQTHALTTTALVFEIDPQISPDGSRVAYVSDEQGNMDIWIHQIVSGQKRNLTVDYEGYDGTPVWSPDGNWIAFISSRDGYGIYKVSEYGGAPQKVVSQTDLRTISWSPDGTTISYSAQGKLFTVPIDGGKAQEIDLPNTCLDQSWGPDGKYIVYTTGEYSKRQIFVKPMDDRPPVRIFDEPGSFYTPLLKDRGHTIFYKWNRKGTRDVWWVAIDEAGHRIKDPMPLTSGLDTYDFSLSDDLKKIAYSRGGQHFNIYAIPIHSNKANTVEKATQITSENQWMQHLSLSPDHQWFAFTTARIGALSIWIVDREGQNLRRLTPENVNAWNPAWAPDGKSIAFHSDMKNNHDIYTIPVGGGPVKQITDSPSQEDYPTWSHDGSYIAYFSDKSGNFDIWRTTLEDGSSFQLTSDSADDRYACFSPVSNDIAFISDRTGYWEIFLIDLKGSNIKQLTRINATDVIGISWSTDGRSLFFSHDPGTQDPGRKIWELNLASGAIRKILDFKGPSIQGGPLLFLAADDQSIFYIKQHHISDIWIGEIEY